MSEWAYWVAGVPGQFANLLPLALSILIPALAVMAFIIWALKRQHDPMILDRKREKEARARRRARREER